MKFALVNGIKTEAKKGLHGLCPGCGSKVISKCGEKRTHHWSHKGKLNCDPWKENETEWHRGWKGKFPNEWQEIVHRDELTGEKHIADVKTSTGIVLEFQHSPITREERKSRNDFYKEIIWIVDGLRVKSDLHKVTEALRQGKPISDSVLKITPEACSVFKEWASPHASVFFDFGGSQLVWLFPTAHDGFFYVTTLLSRGQFVRIFLEPESKGAIEFHAFLKDFPQIIDRWNNPYPRARSRPLVLWPVQRRYSSWRRRPL